ncbi:MAG: hypothetical protein LWY06_05680 [Firmicutes bacterium]|nr:hypothetical protein [Bacillota bacterium]
MDKIGSQPSLGSQFIQSAAKQTLEQMDAKPAPMYHITRSEQSAWEVFSKAVDEKGTDSERKLMEYANKASANPANASNRYGGTDSLSEFARKGVYVATLQNMAAGLSGTLSKCIAQVALDSYKNASACGHGEINKVFSQGIIETGTPSEKAAMSVLNSAYDKESDLEKSSNAVNSVQLSFMKDVTTGAVEKPLKEYLLEKATSNDEANHILGQAVAEKLATVTSGSEKAVLETAQKSFEGNKLGKPYGYTAKLIEYITMKDVKESKETDASKRLASLGGTVLNDAAVDNYYFNGFVADEAYLGKGLASKGDMGARMQGLTAAPAYMASIAENSSNTKEKVLAKALTDTFNIAQNQDIKQSRAFLNSSWETFDYGFKTIENGTNGPIENHLAACGAAFMGGARQAAPKMAVEIAQPLLQAIANNADNPKNAAIAKEALSIETSVGKAIKSTFFIGESNKEYKIRQYTEAFKKILENVDSDNLGTPNGTNQTDVSLRAKLINNTVPK